LVEDVVSTVDHLCDARSSTAVDGGLGALRITHVVGHSMGANVALLYASDIRCAASYVVALSPRFDMQHERRLDQAALLNLIRDKRVQWAVRGFRQRVTVTLDDMRERLLTDMSVVRQIAGRTCAAYFPSRLSGEPDFPSPQLSSSPRPALHALLLHGDDDEVIPVRDAVRIHHWVVYGLDAPGGPVDPAQTSAHKRTPGAASSASSAHQSPDDAPLAVPDALRGLYRVSARGLEQVAERWSGVGGDAPAPPLSHLLGMRSSTATTPHASGAPVAAAATAVATTAFPSSSPFSTPSLTTMLLSGVNHNYSTPASAMSNALFALVCAWINEHTSQHHSPCTEVQRQVETWRATASPVKGLGEASAAVGVVSTGAAQQDAASSRSSL
jgi:hypothetical protein